MTGTAKTEEGEFRAIYKLDVVTIPTNKPNIRLDEPDIVFTTEAGKIKAIVEEIKRRHATGQPILIGTITIDKSELLSKALKESGIKHVVLNAKNHEQESQIVAQAGRKGAVTIATNMAGRGTDILLGGNPEFMAKKKMKDENFSDEQISPLSTIRTTKNFKRRAKDITNFMLSLKRPPTPKKKKSKPWAGFTLLARKDTNRAELTTSCAGVRHVRETRAQACFSFRWKTI